MYCLAAEDYFDRPSIKTLHALLLSLFCPVNLTETTHDMNIHVCAFLRLASLNEHIGRLGITLGNGLVRLSL